MISLPWAVSAVPADLTWSTPKSRPSEYPVSTWVVHTTGTLRNIETERRTGVLDTQIDRHIHVQHTVSVTYDLLRLDWFVRLSWARFISHTSLERNWGHCVLQSIPKVQFRVRPYFCHFGFVQESLLLYTFMFTNLLGELVLVVVDPLRRKQWSLSEFGRGSIGGNLKDTYSLVNTHLSTCCSVSQTFTCSLSMDWISKGNIVIYWQFSLDWQTREIGLSSSWWKVYRFCAAKSTKCNVIR